MKEKAERQHNRLFEESMKELSLTTSFFSERAPSKRLGRSSRLAQTCGASRDLCLTSVIIQQRFDECRMQLHTLTPSAIRETAHTCMTVPSMTVLHNNVSAPFILQRDGAADIFIWAQKVSFNIRSSEGLPTNRVHLECMDLSPSTCRIWENGKELHGHQMHRDNFTSADSMKHRTRFWV